MSTHSYCVHFYDYFFYIRLDFFSSCNISHFTIEIKIKYLPHDCDQIECEKITKTKGKIPVQCYGLNIMDINNFMLKLKNVGRYE